MTSDKIYVGENGGSKDDPGGSFVTNAVCINYERPSSRQQGEWRGHFK